MSEEEISDELRDVFMKQFDLTTQKIKDLSYNGQLSNYIFLKLEFNYIDKITTTNSTGILEAQDSERLKVVDCIEFFKEYERNN